MITLLIVLYIYIKLVTVNPGSIIKTTKRTSSMTSVQKVGAALCTVIVPGRTDTVTWTHDFPVILRLNQNQASSILTSPPYPRSIKVPEFAINFLIYRP